MKITHSALLTQKTLLANSDLRSCVGARETHMCEISADGSSEEFANAWYSAERKKSHPCNALRTALAHYTVAYRLSEWAENLKKKSRPKKNREMDIFHFHMDGQGVIGEMKFS